jgi:hypothetical protein
MVVIGECPGCETNYCENSSHKHLTLHAKKSPLPL